MHYFGLHVTKTEVAIIQRSLPRTRLVRTNICFMDEWQFLTKLPWGTQPSGRGGQIWVIGDLKITCMHHTAGAHTGFLKRRVYRLDPLYEKRGVGGRENAAGPISAPTTYLLNGEGGLALGGRSNPPPLCTPWLQDHVMFIELSFQGRLVILLVAFSVTRFIEPNGKNVFLLYTRVYNCTSRVDILDNRH